MHVVFRESHGLEETETPTDLGQDPADLVVLSFSDSDLGAFAAGWHRAAGGLPALRLANLAALRHPLSVDTYVERTLAGARGILIRLIGGTPYWAYGLAQVEALARVRGIALAVLPADGRPDERLDAASTLPVSTLRRLAALCDAGGAVAAQAALAQMALAAGLYSGPVTGAKAVPEMGGWTPEAGVSDPATVLADRRPVVAVTFYRAYVAAADLSPVEALFAALRARGFAVMGLFAPSLKAPGAADWIAARLREIGPVAVVNATAFSARDGGASPLDAAGAPVFQVALATSTKAAWREAERGLSPADLAMHVVLPEVDGRILAGAVSFKEAGPRDPALQFARVAHRAEPGRIAAAADRVAGWVRLAALAPARRRVALVLSTYPGRDWQMVHAVGLDALASAEAMLEDLAGAGHAVEPGAPLAQALAGTVEWPVADYRAALSRLPARLREELAAAWGDPPEDPACVDGAWRFRAVRRGAALVALQPERGAEEARADEYHDLRRVPRHGYVAFYLWLRTQADALVHVGAHGTLEWLPGKAVALSEACWPEALTGALPVVYPFIVNDPGEAAQAKRRIGAVTLGHVPPPLRLAGTPERLARLEALLDEFSNADGLDPRRRGRLVADIRDEARAAGVEADLRLPPGLPANEAIARIDRFVCDVKESQFGDGLHVWGRGTGAAPARVSEGPRKGAPADPAPAAVAAVDARQVRDGLPRAAVLGFDSQADATAPATAEQRFEAAAPEGPRDRPPRPDGGRSEPAPRAGAAEGWPQAGVTAPGPDAAHAGSGAAGAADASGDQCDPPDRRACLDASTTPRPTASKAERVAGGRRSLGSGASSPAAGDATGAVPSAGAPGAEALGRRGLDAPGGRPPLDLTASMAAERRALVDALAGRRIEPGPSGSPFRGRADVLPTGRNLYTTDPRAVPTRAAHAQGVRLADELVRRHLQDHGDWPRGLVVDLWGSATMRTAGEEFAMALHLLGARPVWDEGSGRVSGVEILPLALLDRPRIDVTLRVSGLFRDVFPTLSALFNQAVRALAARDEAPDWNPHAGRPAAPRVYGPRPGAYGLGLGAAAEDYTAAGRRAAGEAWLAASAWATDGEGAAPDPAGIAARVAAADAFVHLQDLPETDLLLAADYAGHEAGFAAAQGVAGGVTGGRAALWHLDATDPERPRARALSEEVARVVRGRAANPAWIAGMRRHGFRGAAEIAATLEHLAMFAHLAGVVEPHLFDLYHAATLGDPEVEAFLAEANPGALAAMRARFAALRGAGLWTSRLNSAGGLA